MIVVPLSALASAIADRRLLTDRRWLAGASIGVALALLHPTYIYLRYGVASLQINATTAGLPAWAEISVALFDPNVGLVANFPAFAAVAAAAVVVVLTRRPRQLVGGDVAVAVIAAAVFAVAFGKAGNLHHGATPNMSRYALWFVPLAVPVLARAATMTGGLWGAAVWTLAAVSAIANVFSFHPRWKENSREPTWAATWLWTRHPTWHNPLPEIFIETIVRIEANWVPAWTPGCEKILLGGRGDVGVWPIPCYPQPMPDDCKVVNAFCYANLQGDRYAFAPAPGQNHGAAQLRRDVVWPAEAEPHVRSLFNRWHWRDLAVESEAARTFLRHIRGVRVTSWGAPDRYLFVLQSPQPDALLVFRPPGPMSGFLMDARTGHTIDEVSYRGERFAQWPIAVPSASDIVVLALRVDAAQ
jgi:hypothetical protein